MFRGCVWIVCSLCGMPAQFVRDLLNGVQVELAAATSLISTKNNQIFWSSLLGLSFLPLLPAHHWPQHLNSKNIRGLSVGFPSTLVCEHLNLFARQFLCVYCRCWPQKVLQSWMHWNVKQSSMAYRWFQWTKQVVFVKKNPRRKACFRWLPFIISISEWIVTQVSSWWTSATILIPCIFWLCWFTADTSVDVHVDTSCCWKNKGTVQL